MSLEGGLDEVEDFLQPSDFGLQLGNPRLQRRDGLGDRRLDQHLHLLRTVPRRHAHR